MNDYHRAASIVLAALDLPADQRHTLLDRECGDDAALRSEVASLLDAHARAGGFLETPPDIPDLHDGPLEPGADIGAYRILSVLGEGGMGIVYRAEDTRLGRIVALKSIRLQFTDDARWRERLRREARAAAALAHPGIATVFALEEIDGRLYLATELVAGETLRARLARGPLAEAAVRDAGRQLADALAAAHDRGIVHRDMKPENVMWTPSGAVKILDFGLARIADSAAARAVDAGPQLTQDGAAFGTPAYMSPEQLRGEPAGPAADIYAVGVMLSELATGHHPFAGATPAVTVARSLSAEPDLADVPASLIPIIRTCLAKSADARYHSAHELRAALTMPPQSSPAVTSPGDAFWWWQFDQAAASAFSLALALIVWTARDWAPAPLAKPLVFAVLIAALAATTLRLHTWFTARTSMDDAPAQHRRVSPWIKTADLAEAAGVATAGLLLPATHPLAAALLVASSVVRVLVSLVIGPARASAAQLD